MKQEAELRQPTLEDLWILLRKNLLPVALAGLVAFAAVLAANWLVPPRYRATATLYILHQEEAGGHTAEDFNLSLKMINDCAYLLKSHAVLDPIIGELGLDMDYRELYDAVSTANPEGTRLLTITAEAADPREAKAIVDAICVIGMQTIRAAMDYDQVSLYEYGIPETEALRGIPLPLCLAIPLGAAALVYGLFLLTFLLDDRIYTESDVTEGLGIPFLGELPGLKGDEARQSWHALRTELRLCCKSCRCIAITGWAKGEGRTTTALQLGRGLAVLGKKVLVIRGDLRRGTDSIGLSQILAGSADLSDCIRPAKHLGLFILPPGKQPEDPAELLSGDALPGLLEELRQEYDWVLIDTPPLSQRIDGMIISACCDGALLVLRQGAVSLPDARRCLSRLKRSGTRLLGAVLTHAPTPMEDSNL